MISVKTKLLKAAKHTAHAINPPILPQAALIENVPYFSQWESPELVDRIVKGGMLARNDPNWKKSGARSKIEYAEWSWNMCGMACLKMILAHRNDTVVPVVTLGKLCLKQGGYSQPFDTSNGMDYRRFVAFIKKEFNISAKIMSPMLQRDIMVALARGDYVMASVSSMIRSPESRPRHKGGHLVLVLGYDLKKKIFLIHNPSGSFNHNQTYAELSFRDFARFFAERGIVIGKAVKAKK